MVTELRTKEPNALLIKELKDWLVRAEAGQIQGYVGVIMFEDGNVGDCWTQPPKPYHTTIVCDRVIGALARLSHKLLAFSTDADEMQAMDE